MACPTCMRPIMTPPTRWQEALRRWIVRRERAAWKSPAHDVEGLNRRYGQLTELATLRRWVERHSAASAR